MKRRISPPREFRSPSYALFYLENENKYVVISTTSTLFPKQIDLSTITPLQEVKLRDHCGEFVGRYITHSESNDEMKMRQSRLQRFIDSGKHIDANTSLRFLQESFEISQQDELEAGPSQSPTPQDNLRNIEQPAAQAPSPAFCDSVATQLTIVIDCLRENNRLQRESAKESAKLRRLLNRFVRGTITEPQAPVRDAEGPSNIEQPPVLFGGVDLLKLKPHNLDVTNYAIKVARKLWSDDELKTSRLLPKRDTGRRGSMSPTRTQIFKQCIEGRFNPDDEDQMTTAVAAVNQLGSDIHRGKRTRKE